MALLAATRDREAAQVALAEAKTRQEETTEVLDTFPVLHTLFGLEQLLVHCYMHGQHCKAREKTGTMPLQELNWCMKELAQLQKEKNDWRCNSWLEAATGRSTVLAAPTGKALSLPRVAP